MKKRFENATAFFFTILTILAASATVRAAEPNLNDVDFSKIFPKNATILFQGDSITDGNRGRSEDPNHILGHGYAFAIACELGGKFPEANWRFLNRGVSGDTLVELKNRWDADTVALNPNVLSVMIGVNDLWRGGTPEDYRTRYDELMRETKEKLPNTTIIIVEPFASEPFVSQVPERGERLPEFQKIAREIAEKYDAIFVPTQARFDEAAKRVPDGTYWIWDGAHPTYNGHWILRTAWLEAVAESK